MNAKIKYIFISLLLFNAAAGASSWLENGMELLKKVTPDNNQTATSSLSNVDISTAFKQALEIGAGNVVSQLGAEDGFNDDSAIHIPVPKKLKRVEKVLSKIGMSGMTEDLELKLNRAAEKATPIAKQLFIDAISDMSFDDVRAIYNGPNDSATLYFKEHMSAPLKSQMQPIVETTLSEVGAIGVYDDMISKYKTLPFVPDVKADLVGHVLDEALEGIFYYLAKEEEAIRKDPVKQTTEILKKVFGAE